MVCLICTTNLSHGLTPHLILDLALMGTDADNKEYVLLVGNIAYLHNDAEAEQSGNKHVMRVPHD
jgi:hypothetical protein